MNDGWQNGFQTTVVAKYSIQSQHLVFIIYESWVGIPPKYKSKPVQVS
jgi:hypothetical protein